MEKDLRKEEHDDAAICDVENREDVPSVLANKHGDEYSDDACNEVGKEVSKAEMEGGRR